MIFHAQSRHIQPTIEEESHHVVGRIVARALPPELTKEEFEQWWPRLTEKEKDRYSVYETYNVVTTNGRTNLLTYLGNNALAGGGVGLSNVVPFSQFFSVGTGALVTVSAGDTTMVGELFRSAPSLSTISGNTVNVSTFFGAVVANGVYTNAGLWGNNATSTLGSGMLMTHALYSYTKTAANSLTSDYLLNLN